MHEFSRYHKSVMTDVQIGKIWDSICKSGRAGATMYSLPPMDAKGFIEYVRRPDIHWWMIAFRKKVAGMVWLTEHVGKTAYAHFCQLPLGTQRTQERKPAQVAFGQFTLANWLYAKDAKGEYLLDRLFGLTPLSNKKALHLADLIGGKAVAVMEGACFMWHSEENEDGRITIFKRDNVPAEYQYL